MRKKHRRWLLWLAPVPLLGLVRVGGANIAPGATPRRDAPPALDLSAWSDAPPEHPLRLLFIHHSVGDGLLAEDGGGLRRRLEETGYEVHEATYGSRVGEHTDLPDYVETFGDHMTEVLRTSHQDEPLPSGATNDVVMFKSCYPANDYVGAGDPPGDPRSYERTVANAQASLRALLPMFRAHPEVLFVYLTPPPMPPRVGGVRLWRWPWERLRGRVYDEARVRRSGALARRFADWAVAPHGWLRGYEGRNVVAFDYYDVLTGHGRTNFSLYATDDGWDAHPSSEGQTLAAGELVPFLNRAVRRAGLVEPVASVGP